MVQLLSNKQNVSSKKGQDKECMLRADTKLVIRGSHKLDRLDNYTTYDKKNKDLTQKVKSLFFTIVKNISDNTLIMLGSFGLDELPLDGKHYC